MNRCEEHIRLLHNYKVLTMAMFALIVILSFTVYGAYVTLDGRIQRVCRITQQETPNM